MNRRRTVIGWLIAALALILVVGGSSVASACAMPAAANCAASGSACDRSQAMQDCALSCAPLCTAIAPERHEMVTDVMPPATVAWHIQGVLRTTISGPEPPPPRAS